MTIASQLERFTQFVNEEYLEQLYDQASMLAGKHIVHLNTTENGGGVAEILRAIAPLTETFGIHHTRKIVSLDSESNTFTTRLVDLLQGGLPGELPTTEQQRHLEKLSRVLAQDETMQADLYVVHDFQLVPLARLYSWLRPVVWFSHVDTAQPNPHAELYIRHFLDDYELYLFNTALSVFKNLPPEKVRVITLGIDPFKPKHEPMTQQEGKALLQSCGIDPTRPLITQVSRFDRWKNPWQVIDIYRSVKSQIPDVQVALVGAMQAADDINAGNILREMQQYAGGDPDIHLLYDPDVIMDPQVNAFQRYSDVILQRSTREGFGLTVTEAMWKYQPVVGTTATGLHTQIIHEYNGYIADDTPTSAEYTCRLLQDHALKEQLGQQAHDHVRQNYLLPMMIKSYIDVLSFFCADPEAKPDH